MKYTPSDFARHMAALDGGWYETRQVFLDKYGRPDEKNPRGQKKFEEFLLNYIKDIDERREQLNLNFDANKK